MGDFISLGVHMCLFLTLYFEVFLLISFLEAKPFEKKIGDVKQNPAHCPTVSIIVPCYNEEKTVTKTLESLLALDYPKDKLSILVIDDGSIDTTWNVLQIFSSNPQIALFQKENGGKHTALNLGLGKSQSELVGCLDADSFVAPDALKELVKAFENPEVMAVTPSIEPTEPRNLIQLIQKAEYSLSIFIRRTFAHLNGIFITPGPFSIFRREVFNKLGVYKAAHNTEDLEFGLRMQSNHFKIENAPTAHVFTNTPKTLRALFRQRLRWTYGYLKNSSEYRYMFFSPQYGNLGMFVLPIATAAIFAALYFAAVLIYRGVSIISQKLVEIRAIGVQTPDISNFEFAINWFFIPTGSAIFLILTIIVITVTLTVLGKKLSGQSLKMPLDILAYVLLYGFLAPWWLARAVYNALRSRQSDWTAERR